MIGRATDVCVLHVDDEPAFADLTATALEQEDESIVVETASSAETGIECLESADFDCVVSDYDMPGRNGIEFLEAVRKRDPDLPFILFTGKGSEEVASEAISAGVTDYLQKEGGTDQYTVLANRIRNAVEHRRSQRLLERSERRLREIIDALPHLLYVVDATGTYLLANEALAEFHDTTVGAIEGSTVGDILDERLAAQVREDIAAVLDSGEPKRIPEVTVTNASGDERTFEPRLLPYDFAESDERAVLGIAVDITDRRERERELERARERMQLALDQTKSVVFEIDLDSGRVVRYGTYEEFFDNEPETVPTWQDHMERVVHPADRERFREFHEALIDGERERGEIEYRTNSDDEKSRWIRASVYVRDADGRRAVGLSRDVTEHKQRQIELEETERRYQAIFEDPNILIGLLDADGTVLDVNQTAIEYVDERREAVVGEPLWETPWIDRESVREDVRTNVERAASGEYVAFQTDIVGPDDTYTVDGTFRPVTDEDGDVVSVIVSNREITERKQREAALERTNAVLSTLFDAATVGVLAEDKDRTVLAVNRELFDLFDLSDLSDTPDDLVGTDCGRLARAVSEQFADPDGFIERMETIVDEQSPVRGEELALRDGRTLERDYRPVELPDGNGHLWIYRDVTERTERETRLESLNETARELVGARTRDEVAEIGVEAARDVLGLEANAIHLYDEDRSALVPAAVTEATTNLVGEPPTFAAGDSIAWRVYQEGEPLALDDVREDPDVHNPESPVRSELYLPIGEYGILVAGSDTPEAFDRADVVLGEILASDVAAALEQIERTEKIRAREAELTRQNERLEDFASIVSHDLRNPLNVAESRLELAREERDSEHLGAAEDALDRMGTLIDDLLTLAREGDRVDAAEPIDLSDLCRSCWQNVQTDEASLAVRTDQTIQADQSRVRQLFENLIRNATDHGPPDVTVTVGDLDDGFFVEDDGPGIPEDEREAVFEPGYSSEDGTGFGLSIVEQVAHAHGWDVAITESEDGGARFEVTGVETGGKAGG